MRHYYKVHGNHCYLRSFKTPCPRCGVDVLYWECTHGSKVFFNYPPYGKLQRHICRNIKVYGKRNSYKVIIKAPKGLLEDPFISCPVCGSIFKDEGALRNHLNNMRSQDFEHEVFFRNEIEFEKTNEKSKFSQFRYMKFKNSPKFGKINLKENKKE